jgi:hypothetical protein
MEDERPKGEGPNCPKCGSAMVETARIRPFRNDPGLRIFECAACGSSDSRLDTFPTKRPPKR